jgi:DNA polymerase-1
MSSPKIPQTLLIDGDILLYRFACTNEFGIVWEEGQDAVKVVNLESAQFDTAMFIERMSEKLHNEDVVVIFSGQNNFRYKVLPSYKHNRVGLEKPALYHQLKEYLVKNFTTKEKEGLEGDDVMGILATRWPGHFILATIDKDLQQIPGELYNWNTEIFKNITEEEADRYFYKQILMGDSCDGYTGCPGIGPKKAEAILDVLWSAPEEAFHEALWRRVVGAYESKGLTEADALQQAQVARILRASDYDFKTKEIKLWQPSQL